MAGPQRCRHGRSDTHAQESWAKLAPAKMGVKRGKEVSKSIGGGCAAGMGTLTQRVVGKACLSKSRSTSGGKKEQGKRMKVGGGCAAGMCTVAQ
eukprot:scaffold196381_cov19-Tisochrysis_lutea.AAC.2